MTYTKPEVTVLGDAVRVIQGVKGVNASPDPDEGFAPTLIQPAYELDE